MMAQSNRKTNIMLAMTAALAIPSVLGAPARLPDSIFISGHGSNITTEVPTVPHHGIKVLTTELSKDPSAGTGAGFTSTHHRIVPDKFTKGLGTHKPLPTFQVYAVSDEDSHRRIPRPYLVRGPGTTDDKPLPPAGAPAYVNSRLPSDIGDLRLTPEKKPGDGELQRRRALPPPNHLANEKGESQPVTLSTKDHATSQGGIRHILHQLSNDLLGPFGVKNEHPKVQPRDLCILERGKLYCHEESTAKPDLHASDAGSPPLSVQLNKIDKHEHSQNVEKREYNWHTGIEFEQKNPEVPEGTPETCDKFCTETIRKQVEELRKQGKGIENLGPANPEQPARVDSFLEEGGDHN